MERLIIQGIQRLRVLTPYDYDNMDELVHDLNSALEETTHQNRSKGGQQKKGKSCKRRPKPVIAGGAGCSSVPKSSAVSEDSESSLDDRMRTRMEMAAGGEPPQSDSDEIQNKNHLLSWRHCVASLVESDSVNENFLPTRAHRRKRKFKRMAVDPQPSSGTVPAAGELIAGAAVASGPSSSLSPKPRKVKSVRTIKIKGKHSRLLDVDIENICGLAAMKRESTGFCGKRKRSVRERSVECPRHEDHEFRFPLPGGTGSISLYCNSSRQHQHFMDCDETQRIKCQMEGSSSSLSSSESDGGLFTNDEGREGDDEHSDFFHEAGPSCGIPGIAESGWWKNDPDGAMNGIDAQFQALLNGSFQHMSQEAKDGYHESVARYLAGAGREIRAGRRRLGQMRPSFSVLSSVNEQISKFMQDPHSNELRLENVHYSDDEQLHHLATLYSLEVQKVGQNQNKGVVLIKTRRTTQSVREDSNLCKGKASIGDIKRRRRMPPTMGGFESTTPLPDHNIGNRMMRSMGWQPGMGLGPHGEGIQNPLMACIRAKYQGLGFGHHYHSGPGTGAHLSLLSQPGPSNAGMYGPPPPPPPSPQPLLSSSGGDTTPHSESFDATSSIVVGHFQQPEVGLVDEATGVR